MTSWKSCLGLTIAAAEPEIVNASEYNTPKDEKISFTPSCPAKATKDYDRIWTLLRK